MYSDLLLLLQREYIMSNKGLVYYNKVLAGTIEYRDKEYIFTYESSYFSNQSMPSIAISLSKKKQNTGLLFCFPFFMDYWLKEMKKHCSVQHLKLMKMIISPVFLRLQQVTLLVQ